MASRLLRLQPTWNYTIAIARPSRPIGFVQSQVSSTRSDSTSTSTSIPSEKQSDRPNSRSEKAKSKKPPPKRLVPPKRPMNIMQLVTQDVMSEFKQSNKKLGKEDARNCFKVAALKYRLLGDADKKNYQAELERRREQYDIEMREFLDSLTPDDYVNQKEYIRRRKVQGRSVVRKGIPRLDPNAPKRPMNGFMIFCSEFRSHPSIVDALAQQTGSTKTDASSSILEGSKILAKHWRTMDEELKQKYVLEGQRRSDLYKRDKADYDALVKSRSQKTN